MLVDRVQGSQVHKHFYKRFEWPIFLVRDLTIAELNNPPLTSGLNLNNINAEKWRRDSFSDRFHNIWHVTPIAAIALTANYKVAPLRVNVIVLNLSQSDPTLYFTSVFSYLFYNFDDLLRRACNRAFLQCVALHEIFNKILFPSKLAGSRNNAIVV